MIKIIILGDTNIGKTNTIYKYIKGENHSNLTSTIGVEFFAKKISIHNKIYPVYFWDTAGQERFRSIIKTYFRNNDCALLFFDLSSHKSFLSLEGWLDELRKYRPDHSSVFLIGNKLDLVKRKNEIISFSEIDDLMEKYKEIIGIKYISALTGENLCESIDEIIKYNIENLPEKFEEKFINISEPTKRRGCFKRLCGN